MFSVSYEARPYYNARAMTATPVFADCPRASPPLPPPGAGRTFSAPAAAAGRIAHRHLFGDSILPRGGAIALGSLIALAQPFGLNERLVRTATARLAKDGWLEGRRAGKLSEYHLSEDGRERFAEATKRIYSAPETEWSGRWTVIVLPPMRAAQERRSGTNCSGADLARSRTMYLHTRSSTPAR
jgi:hypothetical protein